MKKIVSLGLMVLLTMSVGCNKTKEVPIDTNAAGTTTEAVVTEAVEEKQQDIAQLAAEDFRPFFNALFAYNESDFMTFNQNNEISYTGYFDNLKAYKKGIKDGIGDFLSKNTLKKLDNENTKLDFDLPKKVLINDYVVNASGKIDKIEIESSRQLGEAMIYGIAVTTNNDVQKSFDFAENYGWSDQLGYYAAKNSGLTLEAIDGGSKLISYIYANKDNVQDQMKMVSHYWVEVTKDDTNKKTFLVEGLKQAGAFEVDINLKQKIINTEYATRVPYYNEVTDKQNILLHKVFMKLMQVPKETYYYYEKIYGSNFEYIKTFWSDIDLGNEIAVDETMYKEAFNIIINPYKDNITSLALNDRTISIVPSIYSTKLQPTFVVTLPVKALLKDNSVVYYNYKYFVSTEDNKVEAIQFIKVEEITEEEYNRVPGAEPTVSPEATAVVGETIPLPEATPVQ